MKEPPDSAITSSGASHEQEDPLCPSELDTQPCSFQDERRSLTELFVDDAPTLVIILFGRRHLMSVYSLICIVNFGKLMGPLPMHVRTRYSLARRHLS